MRRRSLAWVTLGTAVAVASLSAPLAAVAAVATSGRDEAAVHPALVTVYTGGSPRFAVKPATITALYDAVLGGKDGSGKFSNGTYHWGHLSWSSWASQQATAHGVLWQDNCNPDCAGGRFIASAVTIGLSAPQSGHFTVLRITFRNHKTWRLKLHMSGTKGLIWS